MKKFVGFAALIVAVALPVSARADVTLQGFDGGYNSSSSFIYSGIADGVTVNLVATNAAKLEPTAFANFDTGVTSIVTFNFSQPISEFSLQFEYVRNDEVFGPFYFDTVQVVVSSISQVGSFPLVTETSPGSGIYTGSAGDNGAGILNWTGLNATQLQFTITTPSGARLGVMQYGANAVPEPSTMALITLGLASLLLRSRRSSRA